MKKAIPIYAAITLLGLMLLLARENIYVAAVILAGLLLLGHREIWSLLRYRRLPVIDERMRENLTSAMRATGVFFFIAIVCLLLLMRFDVFENTPKELIISGQLVLLGLVYVISYYYYDRVLPSLAKRGKQWLKAFLITAALSLTTIPFGIVLHNLISYWSGIEEPVFFILALLVAPAVLAFSLLGLLVVYVKGLFGSSRQRETS